MRARYPAHPRTGAPPDNRVTRVRASAPTGRPGKLGACAPLNDRDRWPRRAMIACTEADERVGVSCRRGPCEAEKVLPGTMASCVA
jgi:hypothetical protein